jgi:hypothetical protein
MTDRGCIVRLDGEILPSDSLFTYLSRHPSDDWGEVDEHAGR